MEEINRINEIVVESPCPPQEIVGVIEEDIEMGILYKAISDNNWPTVEAFIDRYPIVLDVEFGISRGETPLHVAVGFGHVDIVKKLVDRVKPEYLKIHDAFGDTPLTIAVGHGGVAIPIAECLIEKDREVLVIPARRSIERIPFERIPTERIPIERIPTERSPVQLAFGARLQEMGRYLYKKTSSQRFTENLSLGSSFLGTCLATRELGIVLDLLQECKELLFAVDDTTNLSTIESIAFLLPDPLEIRQLPFWKRYVYAYIIPSTTTTEHDVQQDGGNNRAHQGQGLLHRLISSINNLPGMKDIYKMKQQHAQTTEILKIVCDNVMFLNQEKKAKIVEALIAAARVEKVEFLLRVIKANPELASLVIFPQLKGHVFFEAVRDRRIEIFNLLCSFRLKHVVNHDNDLLRMAALLGPSSYLNQISGAALQMQREIQWFKAVESMVDPGYRNVLSNEGLNLLHVFKENHKELRKEGESWMKASASSCSVVGTLIVTIMFAVAFTVPGGNDQTSGYPIFLENKLFKVFLISDALSLISSTSSILMFLVILMSRYAVEDFLFSLPIKFIILLSTLFFSIATMMVTFLVAILIMLQHNSSHLSGFLPIAMLGGIPITLFVFLQLPLLGEVFTSTYGPGIFKKVQKWP